MDTQSEHWLRAGIAEGMFSDEAIATFFDAGQDCERSEFVHRTAAGNGRLRIRLLDRDEQFGLVELPTREAWTTAKVRLADLVDPRLSVACPPPADADPSPVGDDPSRSD